MWLLNFTANISIPQILGVIAGVSLIMEAFRRAVFKFLNQWKLDQLEMHRQNQIRQIEIEREIANLRDCVHKVPGHPDGQNGDNNESKGLDKSTN